MADLTSRSQLTVPAHHQPFTVTAKLAAGIALGGGWGLALDGLLAAQLWAERKARLHAAGHSTARLVDTEVVPDMELPLSICRAPDGHWHWAATCADPGDLVEGHERDIHYWTGRMDNRTYRQTTTTMPVTVATHQGRWRNRIMPVIVTLCPTVTWRGVGDINAVRALLAPVAAIGKKRSQGEGCVLGWHVEPTSADPWVHGHLHRNGDLGRPAPAECLGDQPVMHGGAGVTGLRPPYLHISRQHQLLLPASRH